MVGLKIFSMIVLLLISVAFADVGPSPQPPVVIVKMMKNNTPDLSIRYITYHCNGEYSDPSNSPVEQALINLSCENGRCTNELGWFYKFNPCFSFPGGYFAYDIDGSRGSSVDFNFSNEQRQYYELTIEEFGGEIRPTTSQPEASGGTTCLTALFLLPIAAVAILTRR